MEGIRRLSTIATLAALSVLSAAAFAGAGIEGITVRREANLTSVAVQAIVSGDDDSSAVLRIFQKWNTGVAYDTGMVMVRRTGTRIHEARVLWLTPGRNAHFYIEGRDEGGDFTTPAMVARVEGIRPANASGPVFYADQRTGDDAWDGSARAYGGGTRGPTRTIGAALRALAASEQAGRNGGVFVAPGEYHERLDLDFGTDGDRHFLAGDGTDRDSTIICGANPWVEMGQWAPGHPLAWTPLEDSVWATRFPAALPGSSPGDSTQLVVLGWGEYLHRKTSLKAMLDDSTYAGIPSSTNQGELSGWFWRNDTLYVKRRNGDSPAGQVLHTGYLDALIDVRRRNWRIANLTLRYAGGVSGDPAHPAAPDPPLYGHGISAGVNGWASGMVVDSCRIYGHNAAAIYVVHSWGGTGADSVTIAHCIVDGLGVGAMGFGAGKGRAEEEVGQIVLLSRAANVYGNSITGGFNGLQIGPGDLVGGAADSTWGSQVEISYNTISHVADDAIELDTSHSINTLVLGNRVLDAGHGISQVPTYTGPAFVFYNEVVDSRHGGIKLGYGSTGIAWYVHNTIASSVPGGWAVDAASGGSASHVRFRNNILVARGGGWGYTLWGPAAGGSIGNDFNYDLLDSLETGRLVRWNDAAYSFPTLQTDLGWERNGLRATPVFTDPAAGDWSLAAGSPGVGSAQRITGVNTSFDGPLYAGAPDVGVRVLPAVAATPSRTRTVSGLGVRGSPNPFRSATALEMTLPAAAVVTLRLFDAGGRIVRTPLERASLGAGVHRARLSGAGLPPGMYLFRLDAGGASARGKLVLVR